MTNEIMSADEARAWRDDGADGTREEIARMANSIIALREIIDGRTTPPTAAQIEAIAVDGGRITIAFSAALHHYNPRDGSDMRSLCRLAAYPAAVGDMWHATDGRGRPCAWPVGEVSR